MDFFDRQDHARRSTGFLVIYFLAAVVAIVIAVNLVAVGVADIFSQYSAASEPRDPTYQPRHGLWQPDVIAITTMVTLAVVVGGSLYKIAQLWRGGKAVAELLGATPVP